MRLRIIVLFAIAAIAILGDARQGSAQTFAWAENSAVDNGYYYYNYGLAVDRFGNSFTVGYFKDSITVGTTTLRSPGSYSSYVAKFDPNGKPLWAKGIYGTSYAYYAYAYGVSLDSLGNFYVSGSYLGTATFGSISITSAPAGNYSQYLAKCDSTGRFLWARNVGNNLGAYYYWWAGTLATDSLSNCYCLSNFTGTATIDTFNLTAPAGKSANILVKFNKLGNVVWIKQLATSDSIYTYGISARKSGEIFLTGILYNHTVTFGNVQLVPSSSSNTYDAYLIKFDKTGEPVWGNAFGGSLYDWGTSITSDAAGNVYLAGSYDDTLQIGNQTLYPQSTTYYSAFLAKFTSKGDFQWAETVGDSGYYYWNSVTADEGGNLYYATTFTGTQHFGQFQVLNHGQTDIAIVKFNTYGKPLWVTTGGDANYDYVVGCGIDGYGNTYISGFYYAQSRFSNFILQGSSSNWDGFIAKINEPVVYTHSPGKHDYCAGDTISVQFLASGNFKLGNQYVAQLSDSVGVFDTINTVTIGKTGSISDTGFIKCTIPAKTKEGLYKIRINSTSPVLEGLENGPYFRIHPLPTAKIFPRKPTTFCAGGSTDLAAEGGKFYRWSLTSDSLFSSTDQAITVAKAGKYFLAVTDSNGCQGMDSIAVKVIGLPNGTVAASGPTAFCDGGSVRLTASGGRKYSWSSGENSASITVSKSGEYVATVTNDSGCSVTTTPIAVTVWQLPPTPIISAQGDTLISSSDSNNQWYYYGKPMQGMTDKMLITTVNGDYSVQVHNVFGCTANSGVTQIRNESVEPLASASQPFELIAIPNPFTSSTTLSYDLPRRAHVEIKVLDLLGKPVITVTNAMQDAGHYTLPIAFDRSSSPQATYFVRAVIDGKISTRKIVAVR